MARTKYIQTICLLFQEKIGYFQKKCMLFHQHECNIQYNLLYFTKEDLLSQNFLLFLLNFTDLMNFLFDKKTLFAKNPPFFNEELVVFSKFFITILFLCLFLYSLLFDFYDISSFSLFIYLSDCSTHNYYDQYIIHHFLFFFLKNYFLFCAFSTLFGSEIISISQGLSLSMKPQSIKSCVCVHHKLFFSNQSTLINTRHRFFYFSSQRYFSSFSSILQLLINVSSSFFVHTFHLFSKRKKLTSNEPSNALFSELDLSIIPSASYFHSCELIARHLWGPTHARFINSSYLSSGQHIFRCCPKNDRPSEQIPQFCTSDIRSVKVK